MPDPAEQLARIYQAGFDIETLDRFPKAIAVIRKECTVLLEARPEGLAFIGQPGWRMGEGIGVLVEKNGRMYFQAKHKLVEASPERLERLRVFTSEVQSLLAATPNSL
jgi:hypothetical protein